MKADVKVMTRKPYKSDLTDREWEALEALIPPPKPGGRPRSVNVREILNAIFYVLRTGCSWNMLPHDFPPSSTVYYYFRRWQRMGVWTEFEAMLQKLGRKSLTSTTASPPEEKQYPQETAGARETTFSVSPTATDRRATVLSLQDRAVARWRA